VLWKVIEVEQRKLFKRTIFWIEIGLLSLAIVGLYLIAYSVLTGDSSGQSQAEIAETLAWPAGFTNALAIAAGPNLGGLLIIVLVGATVAQEYTWGSLRLWLSQGIPRPMLLASKYLALLMTAFIFVLTALVVGGLISAVFSLQLLGNLPFDLVVWHQVGLKAILIAFSLLPYGALAFFLAVATRSTAASIGIGLAYTLVIEGIVLQIIGSMGGIWGQIGRYVPGGLAQGLLSMEAGLTIEVGDSTLMAPQFLEPGLSAIGIALYTLTFFILSMIFFRRQDINL